MIFTRSVSEKHPIIQVLLSKVVKALHYRVDRRYDRRL